jgi:hypothetical protein
MSSEKLFLRAGSSFVGGAGFVRDGFWGDVVVS